MSVKRSGNGDVAESRLSTILHQGVIHRTGTVRGYPPLPTIPSRPSVDHSNIRRTRGPAGQHHSRLGRLHRLLATCHHGDGSTRTTPGVAQEPDPGKHSTAAWLRGGRRSWGSCGRPRRRQRPIKITQRRASLVTKVHHQRKGHAYPAIRREQRIYHCQLTERATSPCPERSGPTRAARSIERRPGQHRGSAGSDFRGLWLLISGPPANQVDPVVVAASMSMGLATHLRPALGQGTFPRLPRHEQHTSSPDQGHPGVRSPICPPRQHICSSVPTALERIERPRAPSCRAGNHGLWPAVPVRGRRRKNSVSSDWRGGVG